MAERKLGLVGCGAIGRAIADHVRKGKIKARIVAVCDKDVKAAEKLARSLKPVPKLADFKRLISLSEIVVECASVAAVPSLVSEALRKNRDVVVMSEIGLMENPWLFKLALKSKGRLVVPSGALGGIDVLRAAAGAGLKRVTLVTRKPPAAFTGAPYLKSRRLNLRKIRHPLVLFRGNVNQAARNFPANVNVAATAAMAGVGPRATRVKVIADPSVRSNIHTLEIEGRFGKALARVENVPSPDNPKTSYLAALSAVAAINRLLGGVEIGG